MLSTEAPLHTHLNSEYVHSLLSAAVPIQYLIFVLFSCQPHLKKHYFVLEAACYGRPAHQLYSAKANKTECCMASYCRLS